MKLHSILEKYDKIALRLQDDLKEGVLYFCPQSDDVFEEAGFKQDGHLSEDVTGYWWPSFKEYVRLNLESYMEGLDIYQQSIRKPKTPEEHARNLFKVLSSYVKALNFVQWTAPFPAWLWVVDSLDIVTPDVAKALKISPKDVTHAQRINYVKDNMIELAPYLWVEASDPTVMVYDPQQKPYAHKNGWSDAQVGEILQEWFFFLTDEKIPVHLKKDN